MKLPYGPQIDFDDDAEFEINKELRAPSKERWSAMTSPKYVEQTDRVLRKINRTVQANIVNRKTGIDATRGELNAGKISHRDYRAKEDEHAAWKARTVMFLTKVEDRQAQTRSLVRKVTGEAAFRDLFDVLMALATAVEEHRTAVSAAGQVRPADGLLWARLAMLRPPTVLTGDALRTLQELVEGRGR